MNWIVDNWFMVIVAIVVLFAVAMCVIKFGTYPRSKQMEKVLEWLKWAVSEAEYRYKSGTGQIKLRYVYDMFVTKFPWIAKIITFTQFSMLVDDALEWFNEQIDKNEKIKDYVEG